VSRQAKRGHAKGATPRVNVRAWVELAVLFRELRALARAPAHGVLPVGPSPP
jgi:hypothetical protein